MLKKITFLDKAFWITETDNNPKHVACLQILELPEAADDNYLTNFVTDLRDFSSGVAPFNCVVKRFLGYPTQLKPIEKLDMEYHVKYHQLDDISDRNSLHQLTARLHKPRLDTEKPLWQYHIIESRQGKEFAIYIKIHHLYGDGATLVKWFQAVYEKEISNQKFIPVWVRENRDKPQKKRIFATLADRFYKILSLSKFNFLSISKSFLSNF